MVGKGEHTFMPYTEKELAIIEAARGMYCAHSNDDIEIDDNPELSHGENGTWVQAWVFVHKDEHDDHCYCSQPGSTGCQWR